MAVSIGEGDFNIDHLRAIFKDEVWDKRDKHGHLVYPELRCNATYWMGLPFWRKLENLDLKDLVRLNDGNIRLDYLS